MAAPLAYSYTVIFRDGSKSRRSRCLLKHRHLLQLLLSGQRSLLIGRRCISYPVEAFRIDILRHGAVRPEDDTSGACLIQNGACFCLHLFLGTAVQNTVRIVVKAADHAAMVEDLLAFFHRHAFEKGSPYSRKYEEGCSRTQNSPPQGQRPRMA